MEVTVLECVLTGTNAQFARATIEGPIACDQPRLFMATADAMTRVKQLVPEIVDLAPGNDKPNLERAFAKLRNGGCGYVCRAYTSDVQMRRSAKDWLKKAVIAKRRIVCFIQVPDNMYALIECADPRRTRTRSTVFGNDSESSVSDYLKILPPVAIPEFLEKGYVGNSDSVKFVRHMIVLAAKQEDPVLILGDSGTGKEVVARMLHECRFRNFPAEFKAVNCSAIPEPLFESELFGHVAGAFTDGRNPREGLWKAARNGTLFLDEIGELPLPSQAKILRAIEEKKIRPVGADHDVPVEAHLVMATNQDLFAMTQRGTFRQDLYFRIRDCRIPTPPLREHPEDIPVLANHLWARITKTPGATLPDEVTECLAEYPWPGNVRELRNVLIKMHQWYVGVPIESRSQAEFIMTIIGLSIERLYRTDRVLKGAARAAAQLKHTRKTLEAVIAARILLEQAQQCIDSSTAVRVGMPKQLLHTHRDLASLCEAPLAYGSAEVFRLVHAFAGKLGQFLLEIEENESAITNATRCRELLCETDAVRNSIEEHTSGLMNATRS